MATNNRDSDEHYDRRGKNADEIFCGSCGAIIKAEAMFCPKCGVQNKTKQVNDAVAGNDSGMGKPKGSWGWLIFWVIMVGPFAIIYYVSRRW
jgi:hypothetical protein